MIFFFSLISVYACLCAYVSLHVLFLLVLSVFVS